MENSARALIVEDEELARQLLASYIGRTPHLELAGVCGEAAEALVFLRSHPVDVMFLDVKMPHISGMDFLRTLRVSAPAAGTVQPAVILTTAFSEYALESYELDVADYLLKPFSFDRYLRALHKALQWRSMQQPGSTETDTASLQSDIVVSDRHRERSIRLDSILFLTAYGNYTRVHTHDRQFIANDSLKHFEQTLPARHFCRIHKGTIVARRFVQRFDGATLDLAGHTLAVGITYRTYVASLLSQ